MNKNKQFRYLVGAVVSLEVGSCAIIHHSGKIIRTSTVLEIKKQRDGISLFETRNSFYCVSAPKPVTAMIRPAAPCLVHVGTQLNTGPRDTHPSAPHLKGVKRNVKN